MSDPVFFERPPVPTRRALRHVERRRATQRRRTVIGAATAGVVAVGVAFGVSLSQGGTLTPVVAGGAPAARYAPASAPASAPGSDRSTGATEAAGSAPVSLAPADPSEPAGPAGPTASATPAVPEPEPAPPAGDDTPAPAPAPEPPPEPEPAPAPTPAPPAPPASPTAGPAQQEVLDLVNAERAAAGCDAVTVNDALVAAAQGHAEDMKAQGYFSHTGQDGSSPFDRMSAAGYDYRAAGENIARGQRDAQEVMTGWMNSPGHRANILNCGYGEIGVGYVEGGDGPWWVQKFGSR